VPRFFDSRVALHLKYKVVDEVCRALALAKASRSWCVSRENEPSRAREQGFAMIATLMVVVILGILVTIVLTQAQSPSHRPVRRVLRRRRLLHLRPLPKRYPSSTRGVRSRFRLRANSNQHIPGAQRRCSGFWHRVGYFSVEWWSVHGVVALGITELLDFLDGTQLSVVQRRASRHTVRTARVLLRRGASRLRSTVVRFSLSWARRTLHMRHLLAAFRSEQLQSMLRRETRLESPAMHVKPRLKSQRGALRGRTHNSRAVVSSSRLDSRASRAATALPVSGVSVTRRHYSPRRGTTPSPLVRFTKWA